jgi:poly-gamma-glutamate synthesis protein (capsule biosynthesis protein)
MNKNNVLEVVFAGDFAPCRGFESLVLSNKDKIFGDALNIIEKADISFVNLECPLTKNIRSINKSGPALKADPQCVEALSIFSVVGLANNHILDYGQQGLSDTLRACERINLPTVGAGMNLGEAQKPYIRDVNGKKIAIIALAEHEFNQSENNGAGSAPIDPIDNYQQIQHAKAQADIVIVTLHGGNEYFPYPRPGLRKLCKHYIELGVDSVICHHPHVPGAYEYHQGKPIVYSLGNFLFDNANPPEGWNEGYMVKLNFDHGTKGFLGLELIPYSQSVKDGGVKLCTGKEKDKLLDKIESYRRKLENNDEWQIEWKEFVAKHSESYIMRQFFPFSFRGIGFLARNTPIVKLFFNHSNSLPKLNMLRCQSHRELLTAALEENSQSRDN